jgi:hypothetical protein
VLPRMAKKLEQPENQKSAMMTVLMNGNQWARLLAYVTGQGEPGVAPPHRVFGCGEPHSPCPLASTPAPVGSRAKHTGGDWQAGRVQSSGKGGLRGPTRHDSRLVPPAYRPQVRWFAILYVSWPTRISALWRNWWFASPARTRVGVTTASSERWPTSVTRFQTRLWAISCAAIVMLLGEGSLRRALKNFCEHYHGERNHQGKANKLLFPRSSPRKGIQGSVGCQERLGGLLKYFFYEKVVKVKADVAAILKFFLPMPQIEADHHDAAPVVSIGGMRKGVSVERNRCSCQTDGPKTFRPTTAWLQGHTSPEMLYLETSWASLIPFAKVVDLLQQVLPVGDTLNQETIRNGTRQPSGSSRNWVRSDNST